MARDSSGNYTLPSGNPVVTGTTIDSTVHNNTTSDVATELTDSLSRSAKGGMLAVLKLLDGTVSSPGVQFNNDANTGVYRITTDTLGLAAGGVLVVKGEAATVTIPVKFVVESATAVDLTDSSAAFAIGALAGQHIEFDDAELQSKSDATTAAALAINRLGGAVNIGPQSGSGAVTLYVSGTARVTTTTDGADVAGTVLDLINPANTAAYTITRNTSGGISLSVIAGGDGRVYQTDSAGSVEDIWLALARNGGVSGYFNNILNWFADAQGFRVQSTSGSSTFLDLLSTAGALEGRVITASAGQMEVRAELANRGITLIGSDSGGSDASLFNGLPDGAVTLYYDNAARLLTQTNGATVGSGADLSPSSGVGHLLIDGNGYDGAVTLDGTAMYIGHNSASRNLVLQANTADRLTITPAAAITLKYNATDALATADIATNGSGATVTDGGGTARPVGYNVTPITAVAANTDLRIANSGHQLRVTAAAVTVDIDTTTDTAPDGSYWVIVNESGSTTTVSATGVTLKWLNGSGGSTGNRTVADGSFVEVFKRTNGQYQIVGNGLS